jgi:molybdopterin-binding protein
MSQKRLAHDFLASMQKSFMIKKMNKGETAHENQCQKINSKGKILSVKEGAVERQCTIDIGGGNKMSATNFARSGQRARLVVGKKHTRLSKSDFRNGRIDE